MIGIANAKDWKSGRPHGIPGPPVERERAPFSIDISRSPVGHQLRVGTLKPRTFCAIRNNLDVTKKVGIGITGSIVSDKLVIAGKIEKQSRLRRFGKDW